MKKSKNNDFFFRDILRVLPVIRSGVLYFDLTVKGSRLLRDIRRDGRRFLLPLVLLDRTADLCIGGVEESAVFDSLEY